MFGLVFLGAVWSGDLNRILSADKLQKGGFSQRCIQRPLSEHSLVLMFYSTTGCQGFFPKTIFHIASVCLIWRAAPSTFLPHGAPHGSEQLFLFSLLDAGSQKCFTAVMESILSSAFPQSGKRQKGIQFVLPGQQKENVLSIELHLWVAGDSNRGYFIDMRARACFQCK